MTDLPAQVRLPLAEPRVRSVDAMLEAAESADEAGDVAETERPYRHALPFIGRIRARPSAWAI